jgi:outer membrane cobalamin receptor
VAHPFRSFPFVSFVVSIWIASGATAAWAGSTLVHGTLLDPHGQPVASALVRAEPAAAPPLETRTARDGTFHFDALGPGPVTIRALADGFQADPVTLDLDPDAAGVEVSFTLRVSAFTDSVVVSAAAITSPVSSLPASTTVLTGDELTRSQADTLADTLRQVPGLGVAASGTRGAVTSLFPRGGESDFTLVMFDGVKLNSVGGGFDFAHLPVDGLERVEVIRGPQSALFGADAIGGVVQLVSRRDPSPLARVVVEGGSHDTRRGGGEASGGGRQWSAHAAAQYVDSQGLNGERTSAGTTVVNDDYLVRNVVGGGAWRYAAGEVRGVAHWSSSARGNPGPFGSDPNGTFPGIDGTSRGTTDQRTAGASWQHTLAAGTRLRADVTAADLDSGYRSPYGDSFAESQRATARAQADWPLSRAVSMSAGAEWTRERARNTFITGPSFEQVPVRRGALGTFVEARYEEGGRLFLAAGLRAERLAREALPADPNAFAPRPAFDADTTVSWNPKLAVSWYLRPPAQSPGAWTRVRVNAGTGIRAPDAFEIAFTDNPALAPERSRSIDTAVEQALANGRVVADVTWFANRYDDLIVAVGGALTGTSRYRTDNISNARSRGLEVAGRVRGRGGLLIRAGYTFLSTSVLAVDGATAAPLPYAVGDPLIRRPAHQGFVDLSVAGQRFDGFLRVNARGDWLDVDPTYGAFGGTLPAPGYLVTDMGANWRPLVRSRLAVFARVTNLFDRAYEDVLGYPALGRSLTAGVRIAAGR